MRVKFAGPIAASAAAIAAFCLLAASEVRAQEPPQDPQEPGVFALGGSDANFDPNQPLKPGIQISVTSASAGGPEPDLTGVFPVDPTGSITMKLAGRIEIKGLTPAQAADKIAAALKPYVKDPKVTVAIVSVPKPTVFLSGSVSRAGAVTVNEGTTLAEVLTSFGFSDNADLSRVRIVHKDDKGARSVKEYDFTKWLKPPAAQLPDESQNPVLADRDLVFVPLKALPGTGNVQVEGEVVSPGVVSIRVGVPTQLREVLALAGGPNPGADIANITVRRFTIPNPIIVNYDKMEAGDPTHNFVVQADDVVYVPRLQFDQFINLNGAFVRAGKLPYQRTLTLTQAIGEAGGLQLGAREHEGRIFRHLSGPDPTRTQILAFNYKKVRKNEQPDMVLMPGDTVEVPPGTARPPIDPLGLIFSLLAITYFAERIMVIGSGRR